MTGLNTWANAAIPGYHVHKITADISYKRMSKLTEGVQGETRRRQYHIIITQKELHKILSYDPETGIFKWKIKQNNMQQVGQEAGFVSVCRGIAYKYAWINKVRYNMADIAFMYVHGYVAKRIYYKGARDDMRICNISDRPFK